MDKLGRVLVVDDNPANIQVAVGILDGAGYDTEYALDGKTTFKWLESKEFDAILLDVMIPEMDGFEICQIIKEDPRWKDIPVVFITARADKQSVVNGFNVGATDYLVKPFDSTEMLARVRTLVELKKSKEDLIQLNIQLRELINFKELKLKESSQDLVAAHKELVTKKNELEKIELAKQNFFKIVGNEVGASLHDVTGMLQVIKHRVDSRKVAQLVDRIDQSLIKLETFVNMSLRITELQSAEKQLTSERIELNKLIGYSLFQMDEKIRSKQIRFQNERSNELFYVFGESQLLKACFMILLDFFSERNQPNSEVKISLDRLDRGIVIVLSDKGPLLSQAEQDAVFDIFNMGMRSLSLAKIIVEAHQGELGVYNNPNGGISLAFSLFSNE